MSLIIDGEKLVWLEDRLLAFHNGSIFELRAYNVDNLTLDNFIRTFKFRMGIITTSPPDTTKPIITSISPASGAIGTVVEIRGNNLSGFEGDLIAVFKRSDGKTVGLHSVAPYYSGHAGDPVNTTLIEVKVEPPCQKGQTVYAPYSGKPSVCDYFEFTPGIYKVYVNPWGKKSNEVQFTVKSSHPFPVEPTLKEIEDAKKLLKDQCPCWDVRDNVCLPQQSCI